MILIIHEDLFDLDSEDVFHKILFFSTLNNHRALEIGITSKTLTDIANKGMYPGYQYLESIINKYGLQDAFSVEELNQIYGRVISSNSNIGSGFDIDYEVKIDYKGKDKIDGIDLEPCHTHYFVNIMNGMDIDQTLLIKYRRGCLEGIHAYSMLTEQGNIHEDIQLESKTEVISYQGDYTIDIDELLLWDTAANPDNIITAINIKAKKIAADARKNMRENVNLSLSPTFVETLITNSCKGAGKEYSQLTLEACAKLLIDPSLVEAKPFRTTVSQKSPQRSFNGYLAYRVHLTKSGVAMRLMYWERDGEIVLANVAPKAKEDIDRPYN